MGLFTNFREVIKGLKHKKVGEETIKLCPKCGSTQIVISSGLDTYPRMYGITPLKYVCKNCGYSGAIILEETKEETG
jgi:C4-type Zn-finger protein